MGNLFDNDPSRIKLANTSYRRTLGRTVKLSVTKEF